jgi:GTPase SAR1 family protein
MEFIPELTSELEHDYPILKESNRFLNVYGPSGCGKTTIVKTYMKNRNYHYIDDYNQTMENFIEYIKKITRVDVMSYFMNNLEDTTLIIDNYDYFNFKYKDIEKYIKNFNVIIISLTQQFRNCMYVPQPSEEYLLSLLSSINYLSCKNYTSVNITGSFLKFFSSIAHDNHIEFDNFYSELDCLGSIYETKDINLQVYDINNLHHTYMYHVNDIDRVTYLSNIVSESILFNVADYYKCISNMIVYNLDSKITYIKSTKLNYHKRSKIQKECTRLNVIPEELSLVKKIEK